ncbi:uncharacterized protein DUF4012 [Labedella gwakjiensis]|uniref:Uncharacterized protein DUF4012 n=1 Tax=Labedella gwakjiensis TaxID=390269 RepID=A0A2P8GY73_9MICO|nr:DUF4012 domain-containing protein [Labedella gwakjiensis]PSL38912.1 uncharacterized protein DUF4012 [Labedella gwakjiensis]
MTDANKPEGTAGENDATRPADSTAPGGPDFDLDAWEAKGNRRRRSSSSSGSGSSSSGRGKGTSSRSRRKRARRRRIIGWSIAGVAVVLIAATAWVGIRALLAKDELEAAVPLANDVVSAIGDGDTEGARSTADRLAQHTASAASLTGDPVWRAFEVLPFIGDDLHAVREIAGSVDSLATDALDPLLTLVQDFSLEQFTPKDGALPVQPLIDAQPTVAQAAAATAAAHDRVDAIDTSGTLSPVTDAVDRLGGLVDTADAATDAANRAVQLLPLVLGSDRPRDYLLIFQNSAEPRSAGGIAGAFALLHTENGTMSLTQQATAQDFPKADQPIIDLPTETEGIYGDITGRFAQNITITPQFPLSGELAQAWWERSYGTKVDGVIALDPTTLSYLLRATGPITLATGDQLTSDNAVKLLLQDVYSRYPDTQVQDLFFASTAAAVFSAISSGDVDPVAFIEALAQASSERRVLIWSSDPVEQAILDDTSLNGDLTQFGGQDRYGVYINDSTGAKMGTYLEYRLGAVDTSCRNDGRPYRDVEVTVTSTAPTDAATSLPSYVTGGGQFGVTPGNTKIILAFYGADGSQFVGIERGGEAVSSRTAQDFGLPVVLTTVELAPGETATIHVRWLAPEDPSDSPVTEMTPGVHAIETEKPRFDCKFP